MLALISKFHDWPNLAGKG